MQLQGKTALITGASPNICGGIAVGMAEAGARVVCVDIQPENAHRCAAYIKQRGGQALGGVCDVTDEAQVQAAVFLASDDAVMITGTDLRVEAGALARYWMWDPAIPPA
jgi:NAD(P)-dependent dehydrogenase (short-subunit alcohol dehydrogenase family)